MGKKVYIAEKPSVAISFAAVLNLNVTKTDRSRGFAENEDSIITWCYGHLVTMAFPDEYDEIYKKWKVDHLPIIPEEYKYNVIDGVKNQFNIINSIFNRKDIDLIYVCTDSGREGEYIFRLVYQMSGSKVPSKRVWISSQTEEAIKNGILNAKDIDYYDNLAKSAYSRAKEDWLFGMNFSRLFTCLYGWKLSSLLNEEKKSSVIAIGRVMTCVLGLITSRELEIRHFVPKKHYGIIADLHSIDSNLDFNAKWQVKKKKSKDDATDDEEIYISKEEAESIIEKLKDKNGVVKKVEVKVKNELPPLLFNLAELQSEANKKYKIPVDKTLELAQNLYEKKLITYPRTDCRVLSTDVVSDIPKVLNGLFKNNEFKNFVVKIKSFGDLKVNKANKRYVDDSKVTDHYAIIPTYVTTDVTRMEKDLQNIYMLIVKRFLAAFYPQAQYNTVKAEIDIDKEVFVTNARTLKDLGWKEIYESSNNNKDEDNQNTPIQNLIKKEKVEVKKLNLDEKETKSPPRYTDGSLIITMEKAGKFIENEELREQIKTTGIGTSATRSGIIKKLKEIGYININPKTQIVTPTKKGEVIVELVKNTAKELLNPSLTASWEKGLIMIEKNETTEDIFNEKLRNYIIKTINNAKKTRINIESVINKN